MKKGFIAAVAAALISATSFAQTVVPLLDKACDSRTSFTYKYESAKPGESTFNLLTNGSATLEGRGYAVIATEMKMELRSDGSSVWTIDTAAKEAIIEPASDAVPSDIFSNPVVLVRSYKEFFTVSGTGARYTLTPKDSSLNVKSAVLSTVGDNADIVLNMKDGSVYRLTLSGITFSNPTAASFAPAAFTRDWIVTDLR